MLPNLISHYSIDSLNISHFHIISTDLVIWLYCSYILSLDRANTQYDYKLIMLKLVMLVVGGLWALYLIGKFVLKPYLRMLRYNRYPGAIWVPFIPVMGAFKLA
jgi:Kef-type K+ transport system membrane component KefB